MCVIIIKNKGKKLPKEVAKTSARINPHGLGIIWLDTFEVTYHQSSAYRILDTERPFIAHFRYATVGAVNKDNTHPFRCGSNKNEWLMMNGTIKGLGDAKRSDSRVLAESLGEVPRQHWKDTLEKHEARFVTINVRSRTYQVYNKDLWVQRDGIWYSKDNVLEDNLVAVYGTLKKGYTNYNWYLTSSKFVGSGETKEKYPLVIKGLPYLIEKDGYGHNVEVDVFKVSGQVLSGLDRLESHPTWYKRKQVPIMVKGKVLMCWVYFNIRERADNEVWHKTYKQEPYKAKWYEAEDRKESAKVEPKKWEYTVKDYVDSTKVEPMFNVKDIEYNLSLLDFDDDNDFPSITDEKPMCINCFHDLESDYFSNYYCKTCDSWFGEGEVLKYRG
jgi:gamma-glutamylaminecyclotransferase